MATLKIGDLAQQTGLSVRTLHYYDQIGLLVPSRRSRADHRLYGDDDIERLQRILSLRQLGFSLSEIRDCLENPGFSLPQVIDLHRARLQEQIALSRTLLARLSGIAQELAATQSVAVDTLIETMETMTMSEQYFTPEQQTALAERFQAQEAQWQEMQTLAQDVMRDGTDISSVKVQALAHYWQQLMRSLIGGDGDIYQSLTQLYQQQGGNAASWGALDADTFEYILKAVAFTSLADTVQLYPSLQNFTPEALRALELGHQAVQALHMDVFGTEGLLLGLLQEGTSRAAQALHTAGVTPAAAQEHIVAILGPRSAPAADLPQSESLPFAPRARRVLELAREAAAAAGETLTAPEHLLLGLLAENAETPEQHTGVAVRVLQNGLEVDLEQLRQALAG